MSTLTVANQLTLLRMLLIPLFVILVVYGQQGWALAVFVIAGLTDGLDGLIARLHQSADQSGGVARPGGGQAAAGDDVRRADVAGDWAGEPPADCG